ncbi:MAG: diaminopimelate decarboxylase, partial [Acidimicrobiia bacterium]
MTSRPISDNLLPDSAEHNDGRLAVGGCDVLDLSSAFGTPVLIYDEQQLIDRCNEAVVAFPAGVAFASKAFLCRAMARIAHDAGMHIDVATGGEISVALAAGVPATRLVFHGNNKSRAELGYAISEGVGKIVVDSSDEIDRIETVLEPGMKVPSVLIRLNPGVEAHTHEYLKTGVADSKFGFPIADGIAERAIIRARNSAAMNFSGLHLHVGSQVFDVASFGGAIEAVAPLAKMADAEELSVGGGLGVAYVDGEEAASISDWAGVVHRVADACGVDAAITAEPGRAIVASAAVTAYTIGTIKEVPGIRTYVSVDGGMSDNPRPVLYGSGYEAFLPRSVDADRAKRVRIVGKHCESG